LSGVASGHVQCGSCFRRKARIPFDLNRDWRPDVVQPDNTYSPPQNVTYSNFLERRVPAASTFRSVLPGAPITTCLPRTPCSTCSTSSVRSATRPPLSRYNGSESRHLDNLLNPGQPIPGNAPIVTRMPYPEWGPAGIQLLKADGVANYNGLAAKSASASEAI